MVVLKELWMKEENDFEVKIIYQYVLDFKERLVRMCELVYEELQKFKECYKKNYDKKVKF